MRNINLLPLEHRPEPKFVIKRFFSVLVPTTVIVVVLTGFIILRVNIATTNKMIDTKQESINNLKATLASVEEENNHLRKIRNMVNTIEKIEESSLNYINVLKGLQKHTPNQVEFNNLNINKDSITIHANAPNMDTISLYLTSLNSWDMYQEFFIPHINYSEGRYVFQVQGNLRRGEQ